MSIPTRANPGFVTTAIGVVVGIGVFFVVVVGLILFMATFYMPVSTTKEANQIRIVVVVCLTVFLIAVLIVRRFIHNWRNKSYLRWIAVKLDKRDEKRNSEPIQDTLNKLRRKQALKYVLIGLGLTALGLLSFRGFLGKHYDENAQYRVYENDRPTNEVISGQEAENRESLRPFFCLMPAGAGVITIVVGIKRFRSPS
jgi:hypothetical protein